jgi:hypothetical protein
MGIGLYVADSAMLVLAVLAAAAAMRELGRRILPRWRLLLPGVLAGLSTALLIAYPELRDLFELQRWTVGVAAFLVGAIRGTFMGMSSDHTFRLVRLRKGGDGAIVAGGQVLFATIEFAAEIRTASESRFEPTVEALMTITAGYLLGRSVAAWFRAGALAHFDLGEE